MRNTCFRRLMALLLCLTMLLPYLEGLPLRAWAQDNGSDASAETPLAVVGAGTDFQYLGNVYNGVTYEDDYAANKQLLLDILGQIKPKHPTMDAFLICGDYDGNDYVYETSSAGIAAAYEALNETYGLTHDQIQFVQGNHDPANAEGLDATGAYDRDHFGVYQINEDDYSWGQSSLSGKAVVEQTAANLKSYLDAKVAAGYRKPIFVITHLPLHQTSRGDNLWGKLLADVLNEAAAEGLNIIYLYGHNHSGSYDKYIGGDCVYLQPGDPLLVPDHTKYTSGMTAEDMLNNYVSMELGFTYMVPGYIGYVSGDLSSTVFEIYEDRVEIARYSRNGLTPLRKAGSNSSLDGDWDAVTTAVESPQTLSLSNMVPFVAESTLEELLGVGETATVQIGVLSDNAYSVTWSSLDDQVVTVAQDSADQNKATVTGVGYGSTSLKIVVTDTVNPGNIPATLHLKVTVAPDNAVRFNDSNASRLYRLVTDWSTLGNASRYMILDRDTAGGANAMGGPETSASQDQVDPETRKTRPVVFELPGEDGLFTTPVSGSDSWSLIHSDDAFQLRLATGALCFVGATKPVDADMSYSYPCGFRYASSATSSGSTRWSVDAENKALKLHSYYKSGAYVEPAQDFGLYYNSAESRFEISNEATGPVSLYEWLGNEGPEIYFWLTSESGEIVVKGDRVTGARLAIMSDGEIYEQDITTAMLQEAYTDIPGTRTCTVCFNDTLISDQFRLTVTGEDGRQIEPVPLLINNGNLFKLHSGSLPAQPLVIAETRVEGDTYVFAVQDGGFRRAPAKIFASEQLEEGVLYLQAEADGWIFDPEAFTGEYYYMKNRGSGTYLTAYADNEQLGLSETATVAWRQNSTYNTISSYATQTGDIQRTVKWDGSGYYAPSRDAGGYYTFCLDTSVDRILAYVSENTGTVDAGTPGQTEGGSITVMTYYKDGTSKEEILPINTGMLNISALELFKPGNYRCSVTYQGKVLCDDFLLSVNEVEGDPLADEPVVFARYGEVFKMTTTITEGQPLMLVTTKTPVPAYAFSVAQENGTYSYPAVPVDVFTLEGRTEDDGSDSLFVISGDESCIFVPEASAAAGKYYLYNGQLDGYVYGDNAPRLHFVQERPGDSNHTWRYSGTYQTIQAGYEAILLNQGGAFVLSDHTTVPLAVRPHAFVRDEAVDMVLAYPDSLKGNYVTGTEAGAVGGNVVLKTIFKDGTVSARKIPITLDMLDLSSMELLYSGVHTCKVVYNGVTVTDEYELTVTSDAPAPADDPVVASDSWKYYKRITANSQFAKDGVYVLLDANAEGSAHVLTLRQNNGQWQVTAVPTDVLDYEGSQYVIVKDDSWDWKTAAHSFTMASGATGSGLSLQHSNSGLYLGGNVNYELTLNDQPHSTYAWRYASGGYAASAQGVIPEGSATGIDMDITFMDGAFKLSTRATANANRHVYAYIPSEDIQTMVLYTDSLKGQSITNASGTTQVGGNVVISTQVNGNIIQEQIPITLDMLGLTGQQKMIPGTYTCTLTYGDQVLTEAYELTVTGTEGENPPAAPLVTLIAPEDLVFRSTSSTWVEGSRYILVNTKVEGPASALKVTSGDGEPAILAHDGSTFLIDGSEYLYFAVKDPDLIFDTRATAATSTGETVTAVDKLFLQHEQTGKYLFVDEQLQLRLVEADELAAIPNGWRLSGACVTGSSSSAPYAELIRQEDTFVARPRVDGDTIARAFVLEDIINTRLAYVDSVTGACDVCAGADTVCGGNIVLKTLLEDGTCQTRVVPITLEMLDLTYSQLCVPGDYTTTVTYEGQVICDAYTISVNAQEGEKLPADTPVVLIEEGADVFRLYQVSTDWYSGNEYVFVDTAEAGEARLIGVVSDGNGGWNTCVHDSWTFSVGDQGIFVTADGKDQIWTGLKTAQTSSGTVSPLLASRFFVRSNVSGRYLFADENYNLLLSDGDSLVDLPNGWRVSTAGSLVTGDGEGNEPYADLVPRGSGYVARGRRVTSGNTVDTSRVYVRDDSIRTALGYVDQLSGVSSIDSTETYACGGNVLIKTILSDGGVVTDTVPITLDMLSLSYGQKHTPGTYTCQVIYRGEVITDEYQLTVTGDGAPAPQGQVVTVFENNGTLFMKVYDLAANEEYVFVDSAAVGEAAVMTRGENGTFPAVDTRVFTIEGKTGLYVAVEDISSVFITERMYNRDQTTGVYTLYAPDTGEYLYVNDQLQLVMTDRSSAVPSNSGWVTQGVKLHLGYGVSGQTPYVTLHNPDGLFQTFDRYQDATNVNGAYIYKRVSDLEGQVAYVTALEGSCGTGGDYDASLGGELVVKTYHTDGTVTTEQLPINLSMLQGYDPLDLYVAGQHRCSLVYNGKVITDSYTLNIIDDGTGAASKPIVLADENSLIFRQVNTLVNGEQYVFVNGRTSGFGFALSVGREGTEYVPDAAQTVILEDGKNALVVAQSQDWIWEAATFTQGYSLYNSASGQYLLYRSGAMLGLGSLEGATVGWRITSTQNVGDVGAAGNHDLYNTGEGFALRKRNSAGTVGYTYAYQRDESVELILAYMDSLTGTIRVGQDGLVHPGGNVLLRTFYTDGSSSSVSIPVTPDMLDLTLTQLNTPGTYTTSVTCNGQVITEEYVLTVTGEENDALLELPGNGKNILGYLTSLDSNVSDVLPVASGGRIPTGSHLTVYTYYNDGNVEMSVEPITVDMLSATAEQLTTPGTYTDLTLTYNRMLICEDYTLRLAEQVSDDYPDFPNEGSVKVDKQMNTTKYNYLQTGTAQIDLSVAGIPTTNKANVVVILDASSSMTACTHGIYASSLIDDSQRAIIDKAFAGESLSDEEITFLQSLDWPNADANAAVRNQDNMQKLIDGTITANELTSLKKGMRFYGLCYQEDEDTLKWVGDGEENCKPRSIVTQEALAELLEFLQQDMEGYDMDIDVAVAYFNQLYATDPNLVFLGADPVAVIPRSQEELMLPFTNSKEVVIQDVLSRYKTISGTNYDRGMEWIYQLLSEKQTADYQEYLAGDTSQPYRARKDFVLFMSDGEPGQYNYMLTNNASEFAHFFSGTIPEDELDQYVSAENLPAFKEMYNPEGKLWLAEAIKGEKTQKYKIIDPSMPETNYVNYVSGLGATMMTVTLNAYASVMYRIASSEDFYIPTETADDIQQAFGVFGDLVTSGSGSYFMDQMGDEFDLQMKNSIDVTNIKDLYKSGTGKWDSYTGQKTTRTIYFDNSKNNWSKVNIYTWDGSGATLTGSWPGNEMIHLGNGICSYEVPAGAVNIIFNNGSSQTADLKLPTDGKSLYRTDTNSWMNYGTRTVYFNASGCSWSEICCYTWGGTGVSTTGGWPGAKMVYLGNNIYSCEIPADATGVIFNNNNKGSQTPDLTVQTNGNNLYRYNSDTWDTYATRTIYYDNSGSNWSSVCAYTWDESVADPNFTTSAWPGMEMKHLGGNIYACEIPADSQKIIFNSGSNAAQTGNLTIPETKIQLNSTITVSTYELYKYSEHLRDPEAVTMDMVGKRKGTEPQVLEQITFSDDGTEAYSNLIDGGQTNILIDGVICAKYFWYNTNTGSSVMIDTDGNGNNETLLQSETFYWSIDAIPEDELVLSYNVYLTDTLEGLREAGSYATNDYATLYYNNHLGNPCQLDTTSPMLPWNQAVVGYAFYLVDADGNPIVNEDQHLTGSFEKSIRMTQPLYIDLLYNSDENVDAFPLVARDVLPEGYSLYDPDAAYHVKLYADGEGGWNVVGSKSRLTTYVTGYGGVPTTQTSATAGMSTEGTYDYPAYATASTVVWFAVRADVNAVPDTVVIDYGLSVDIHVLGNDVVITDQNSVIAGIGGSCPEDVDGNGVIFTGTLAEGFGSSFTGRYGTAAVRGNVVRYTPNTVQMTAEDTFYYSANYRGEKNDGYYYNAVTVIPATSIYYEDNFITFDDNWVQVGQTLNGIQDEDRQGSFSLPQIDANNVYGHDSAYDNMQTWSMGSVMKTTVSDAEPEAIAQFTFTGTGFDIISYTSSDTGVMMLTVQGITDPGYSKMLLVDSYYSLTDSLYQVPVMKLQDLPYGEYWVELYVGYGWSFDHESDGAYDFYLDAIRIYDPANDGQGNPVIENAYTADGEGWPSYQELRNLLISVGTFDSLGAEDEISGVIFIDGNAALEDSNASGKPGTEDSSTAKSAIADYANFGPNNELYLAPGQAVAFRLNVDATDDNVAGIHLGLKSVGGTAVAKVYNAAVNHTNVKEQRLSSASQQYYDITELDGSTVVIWNVGGEGDAILSVTDIKTTYEHQPKNAGRSTFTMNRAAASQALASMAVPAEPLPTLTLKYPSLSFEGEICYNVYFAAEELESTQLGLAVFTAEDPEGTVDTAADVIWGVEQKNGLYMASTNGIPAKNMGDRLYFKVFAKLSDGSYVYSDMRSYNAVDYAMGVLANSQDMSLKALVVAMLNYGAQAQSFFGYNTDALMNAWISSQDQELVNGLSAQLLSPMSAAEQTKVGAFGATGGFSRKYPSVYFQGAFEINYNMVPSEPVDGILTLYCWNEDTYEAVDTLTAENADWAVPMIQENGIWKACSDQIVAKDLDKTVYAAAVYETDGQLRSTGILAYSIAAYCQEQAALPDSGMNAFANAAAAYGYAAKAYFG